MLWSSLYVQTAATQGAFTLDPYSHAIPALEEEAAEIVAQLVFRADS